MVQDALADERLECLSDIVGMLKCLGVIQVMWETMRACFMFGLALNGIALNSKNKTNFPPHDVMLDRPAGQDMTQPTI